MSSNLLDNETHVTDFTGTLKSGTKLPVDGDEIQNIEAGDIFFNSTTGVAHVYDSTDWFGVRAVTTSTSSSTSTSTSTTTTA